MQIDWLREPWTRESIVAASNAVAVPTIIAAGKATMIADRRYRVYRPHNSALSVLIIRRVKKHDAGVYRCNLSGSSTRQKYLVLNVTGLSTACYCTIQGCPQDVKSQDRDENETFQKTSRDRSEGHELQDMKMQISQGENVIHENTGHENARHENVRPPSDRLHQLVFLNCDTAVSIRF